VEVTVWTTVFGTYHRFLPGWLESARLAGPDRILVVSDRPLDVDVDVVVAQPEGRFPEAYMRNVACENGDGWLWQVDVDDRIMPDALRVLEGRECDIVQVGYVSTAGGHRNPTLTSNEQFLNNGHNEWMSGSPFTKDMWTRAGGFPDIAWSDWGFWRRCCRAGARVEAAGRPCYVYREDPSDSVTGRYQDAVHIVEALEQ
jgi:hypothetical protein